MGRETGNLPGVQQIIRSASHALRLQNLKFCKIRLESDNNGVTGLHNSHPRVIAGYSFALTSISFRDLPLLYETIGGSLNILLSNGCC